ncbi:MAG: phospholipid carrier-dependent glycosyltransferase [Desulfobacteraceae bacterium]|nr:phospholipid carrier-dependent glycosyltransferase [Desulfobacteraceae bacterium]
MLTRLSVSYFSGDYDRAEARRDRKYYFITLYIQAVLSALLIPLTFLIGIRFLSSGASIIATVMVAFSPHQISLTSYLLTETLFSVTLLSAIFCFYYTLKEKKAILFAASGVLFGFAYLTNETALFIPFIFALPIFLKIRHISDKQLFLKICIFLAFFYISNIMGSTKCKSSPECSQRKSKSPWNYNSWNIPGLYL